MQILRCCFVYFVYVGLGVEEGGEDWCHMPWHDNVVVADGGGEEIGGLFWFCELEHLLRTAQVWLCKAALQCGFGGEMA